MSSNSLNNLKSITLLTNEKDLVSIKSILKFLKDRFSELTIYKFRTGLIGDNTVVSFKVNNDYYSTILEKFAYNNIPIIMKDKNDAKYIEQKREEKTRRLRAQGWSEITVSNKQVSLQELKIFSEKGKIKEVINEAKGGIRTKTEIKEKAKELLSETIKTAVKNLVIYAEEKPGKRTNAIEQLILISKDKDLRLFHKTEETLEAGITAIQIALTNYNYYPVLLKIANDSQLNNLINVKAALALANLLISNKEEDNELPDVVNGINTRWLKIAFESIQKKISSEESQQLIHFIEFIEESRKVA